MGTSYNKTLQREWNEYGEDAFVFEILETIEPKQDPFYDLKDAVSKREAYWIEQLEPFGEKGITQSENKAFVWRTDAP